MTLRLERFEPASVAQPAPIENRVGPRPRLVVGMAGSPGASYALALLARLRSLDVESHLVTCGCSRSIITSETGLSLRQVRSKADGWYHERNQAAAISSGSFLTLGMVIVPCTMRSLAAIVTGVADNLVQRAADVTMKEGRRLVLAMAESEWSPIGSENLSRAKDVGITVLGLSPSPTEESRAEMTRQILECFVDLEAAPGGRTGSVA